MKNRKKLLGLFLALLIIASVGATPVSAAKLSVADIVKADLYAYTHPVEIFQLGRTIKSNSVDEIYNVIEDPEIAQTAVTLLNYAYVPGSIIKGTMVTTNPQNSESNTIIKLRLPSQENDNQSTNSSQLSLPQLNSFSIIASPSNFGQKNTISLEPLIAYKNNADDLVVLGFFENNGDTNIELRGISYIELSSDGNPIASGEPVNIGTPMKFSTNPEGINLGVYDGLPNMCFVKITFEPGAYDETLDVSQLDHVGMTYSLDYSNIS